MFSIKYFCITFISLFTICSCATKKQSNPSAPNILFAIMDDATWEHMSAYGCKWVDTPGFDYVAENGILFNRTYTPNAKCAPSRACILTGRNSWQLEEAANHWPYFPNKFKTVSEVLSENGYHVGHTAKGWAPGIVRELNGQQRNLIGKAYNHQELNPPTSAISKIDYASNFTAFLDDNTELKPFFFWYGSYEPHRAYEYQSGMNIGGKDIVDIDKMYEFWPDNPIVRNDLLDYALEIEYFDSHLQKMIDQLKHSGQLNNTIIVVTADNGMPFPRIKGQEYELSNHMPLAIMWPDGITKKGRKVNDFISFIDFAPTFLELAQIENTGMKSITGRSLVSIFNSSKDDIVEPSRNSVLIGKERHDVGRPNDLGYPIRGMVKGDYLYVKNFEPSRWPAGNPESGYLNCDGSPTKTQCLQSRLNTNTYKYWLWNFGKRTSQELYNIKKDPECLHNLASQADQFDLMREMHSEMMIELKNQGDPRASGKGHIFDRYTYADKNTVDFYNRFKSGETIKTGWVNPSDFEKEQL